MSKKYQKLSIFTVKLRKLSDNMVSDVCKDHNLSITDIRILSVLSIYGEHCTAKEISELLCMPKSGVSASVGSLTSRGYISQAPDPDDRRITLLSLTPAADGPIKDIKRASKKLKQILTAGITAEEAKSAESALNKIIRNTDMYLSEKS